MSTISTSTAGRTGCGGILGRLAAALKHLWITYITWRMQRAAIHHLRSMSDRELEDIGLSRSQIEGAITGAREHVFNRYY